MIHLPSDGKPPTKILRKSLMVGGIFVVDGVAGVVVVVVDEAAATAVVGCVAVDDRR